MTRSILFAAIFFIANSAYSEGSEPLKDSNVEVSCPQSRQMTDKHLQGQWLASVAHQDAPVHLTLGPHPEWAGTVKGTVQWADASYPMVGDVDQGHVTLEESSDEVHITGTWLGQVVDGSCGREIKGEYQAGEDAPPQAFLLRKNTP